MKQARLLLAMMFWTVLLQGTSLAAQAGPAPQRAIPQSSEKSADQQKDKKDKDEVRNQQDQAQLKEANANQEQPADVTRTITKHRPSTSHSKPVPSHQARPAKTPTTNSPRTDAPPSVAPLGQMGSKAAANIPNKAVSRRKPSAPSSAFSVNGQQFKNSHDPGAHLASSGGPLTAARGTAAINGTNMKRKP